MEITIWCFTEVCPCSNAILFVHCPHLGAGTGPQSSRAPTRVLNFNTAGEDPKALGHFLVADLPIEQAEAQRLSEKVHQLAGDPLQLPCLCSPGRLIEGNRADVQLLDLVDGANGEGAIVGQGQAGKKGLGLD